MAKAERDLTMEEQLARGPMDLPFLMLTLMLLAIGLITVFSASYATAYYDGESPYVYFMKQAIFGVAGVAILYFVSKLNYQHWRWMSIFVLLFAILLLVLVIPFGWGRAEVGAQRWIQIGPINFQPSEIAKLGVVLYFSARLSKRGTQKKKKWNRRSIVGRFLGFLDRIGLLELIPYAGILLVIAFLMLLEPHMSGTILILVAGAAILFAAGVKIYWFIGGGAVVGVALWYIINNTEYMTSRIELWKNPWLEELGKGFQSIQSLLAIGSGGPQSPKMTL